MQAHGLSRQNTHIEELSSYLFIFLSSSHKPQVPKECWLQPTHPSCQRVFRQGHPQGLPPWLLWVESHCRPTSWAGLVMLLNRTQQK